MSKWTKTRRPERSEREKAIADLRKTAKDRIDRYVAEGLDAESKFVELIKILEDDLTAAKMQDRIKQFRAAVYERKKLDGRAL